MDFGLATITSVGNQNSQVISAMSDELESYFLDKEYGQDIKLYAIGIVCVAPEFEQFEKIGKPKYTKGKKVLKPDGIPVIIEDCFGYDIKIDFERFISVDEETAKRILAREILNSLVLFDKMKSKIKDFEINSFKGDLEHFFKSHDLL